MKFLTPAACLLLTQNVEASLRIPDFVTPSWTNSDTSSIAVIPTFTLRFDMRSDTLANCNNPLSDKQLAIIRDAVQEYVTTDYQQYLGTAGKGQFFKAELPLPTFDIVSGSDNNTISLSPNRVRGRKNGGRRRRTLVNWGQEETKEETPARSLQQVDNSVQLRLSFAEGDAHFRYSPPPSDTIQLEVLQQFLGDQNLLTKLRNDVASKALEQNVATLCADENRAPSNATNGKPPAFATLSVNSEYTTTDLEQDMVPMDANTTNNGSFVFTEDGSGANMTGFNVTPPPPSVEALAPTPWYGTTAFIAGMAAIGSVLLLLAMILSVIMIQKRKRVHTVKRYEHQYEQKLPTDPQDLHLFEASTSTKPSEESPDQGQSFFISPVPQKSVLDIMADDDDSYEGRSGRSNPYLVYGGERVSSKEGSIKSRNSSTFGGQSSADGFGAASQRNSLSSYEQLQKMLQEHPTSIVQDSEQPGSRSHAVPQDRPVEQLGVSPSSFDQMLTKANVKYAPNTIDEEASSPQSDPVPTVKLPGASPMMRHASLDDYDVCARTHYSSETEDSRRRTPKPTGSVSSGGVHDGSMSEAPIKPPRSEKKSPWLNITSAIPPNEQGAAIAKTNSSDTNSVSSKMSVERSSSKVKPAIPGQRSLSRQGDSIPTIDLHHEVISMTSGGTVTPPPMAVGGLNPFTSSQRHLSPVQSSRDTPVRDNSGSSMGKHAAIGEDEGSLTGSKLDLFRQMNESTRAGENDALKKMDLVKRYHLTPRSTSFRDVNQEFSFQVDERPPQGDALQSAEDEAFERMIRARRLRR